MSRITREKLETFIGKRVAVTWWHNTVSKGLLKNYKGLYKRGNRKLYKLYTDNRRENNTVFLLSHVKKIKELI